MSDAGLLEKRAFLQYGLPMAAGAAINPLVWDYKMNPDENATFGVSTVKDLFNGSMSKDRKFNLGLNALVGTGAGAILGSGFSKDKDGNSNVAKGIAGATGELMLSPLKDLIVNSLQLPDKAKDTMDAVKDNSNKANDIASKTLDLAKQTAAASGKDSKIGHLLAGAGIAGALGLGGLGIAKYLSSRDKADKARIQYQLKGKEGDPTTGAVIDMPIDSPEFSEKLKEGLNLGIKRQVGKTIRYNSLKRDPETGKMIPYEEWHNKYNEDGSRKNYYEKQASALGSLLTGAAGGALGSAVGVSMPGDMNPLLKALIGGGVGLGTGALSAMLSKGSQNNNYEAALQALATRNAINNVSFANTGSSAANFEGDITGDDEDFDKDASAAPAPPQGGQGGPKINGQPGRQIAPGSTPPPVAPDETTQAGNGALKDRLNSAMAAVQNAANKNLMMQMRAQEKQASAYYVDFLPFEGMQKSASAKDEVRGIMSRIYNENPSYWPYGLNVEGHNGGVYLIKDKMTKQAAGFVGWQTMYRDGKKVGSYSIGILPEFRNKGFAKEAVAKIINEKAASVDRVVAYVKHDNANSKGLAASLHVPVIEKF